MRRPRVLTIAGSDPSGGAGLQADLKTFAAFGCYGMAVVTALTAQDTRRVHEVHVPPPRFVARQLRAVLDDCPPAAVKTGMLHDAQTIRAVVEELSAPPRRPLVVDPVLVATSGDRLLRADAIEALLEELLPLADLVTPNAHEAAALTGAPVATTNDAGRAAAALIASGARAVLVKGGHVAGPTVVDVFAARGRPAVLLERPRVPVASVHGAGCTLSAAVAAGLAAGRDLEQAVVAAVDFVHAAIAAAVPVGGGAWPLDHLVPRPEPGR